MQGTANANLIADNLRLAQSVKRMRNEMSALNELLQIKDTQIAELRKLVRYYQKARLDGYEKKRKRRLWEEETVRMILFGSAVVLGLQLASYLIFEAWLAFRAFMG